MKYGPYPTYKDSGVEWIGEVPKSWRISRLKYVGQFVAGVGFPHDEQGVSKQGMPFYKVKDLDNPSDERQVAETEHSISSQTAVRLRVKPVPKKAVLFAKVGAAIGLNRFVFADQVCAIDNNMMAFVTSEGDESYCRYQLWNSRIFDRVNPGAVPSINESRVASLEIPWPDSNVRRSIASFLDTEIAKIGTLVREYEDLIALLTEKRQALISLAVTRGLSELVDAQDPEFGEWARPVRFVDSGVEWLGEIPEGWNKKRLKHLATSWCDGPFGSGLKSEHYTESGVRVIRLQNIGKGLFEDGDEAFVSLSYALELGDHSVLPGDLLLAGLGDNSHPVGRAVVAPDHLGPAIVKADCFRFRLREGVIAEYVSFLLQASAVSFSRIASTGTTRERVNLSTMAQRPVVLPRATEQSAIASFLTRETTKIDTLVRETQDAIELLKEHRSALITAAVTGKINVEALA